MNYKELLLYLNISFIFSLIFIYSSSVGQVKSNNLLYQTWVKVNKIQVEETGYLYAVKPNSLEILKSKDLDFENPGVQEILDIPYRDISQLKIRKKGAVGKGAAKGALIGLGVGIIGGLLLKVSERSKGLSVSGTWGGAYIVSTSIVLVPLGALVGLAIGSSKRKIPIKTNPQYFNDNQLMLEEYIVTDLINIKKSD